MSNRLVSKHFHGAKMLGLVGLDFIWPKCRWTLRRAILFQVIVNSILWGMAVWLVESMI